MTKAKYFIDVDSRHPLSLEQKMELLADFRNALRGFKTTHPDLSLTVSREISNEDIMEVLHAPLSDSQEIENCVFYDEAQGRHKCTNPVVKSSRCHGVCKDYEDKR
jgi:hypothetical protein